MEEPTEPSASGHGTKSREIFLRANLSSHATASSFPVQSLIFISFPMELSDMVSIAFQPVAFRNHRKIVSIHPWALAV